MTNLYDEAFFFSARIYNNKLKEPEKAKPMYEKIILTMKIAFTL
jgi:hypothetical protein